MTVYLLLSTFQSFLMLFYVKDPGFSVSLSSRKRGKYVHYISLETEPSPRIYFFLAVLGLRWGTWGSLLQRGLSLVAASRGYTLVVVHRLLVELASFIAEHPCPLN